VTVEKVVAAPFRLKTEGGALRCNGRQALHLPAVQFGGRYPENLNGRERHARGAPADRGQAWATTTRTGRHIDTVILDQERRGRASV
jgi:hypothetical protein